MSFERLIGGENCIVVETFEVAMQLTKIFVESGYATMITKEDGLWVINFVYANSYEEEVATRGEMVFMNRDEFLYNLNKYRDEIKQTLKEEESSDNDFVHETFDDEEIKMAESFHPSDIDLNLEG